MESKKKYVIVGAVIFVILGMVTIILSLKIHETDFKVGTC